MLRVGALIAALWLGLAGAAVACRVPSSHTGIIYEQAPSAETLPAGVLILEVAYDLSYERRDANRRLRFVTARVRRVVHGEFSGDTIEVHVGPTSCSHPFMFGTEGYMVVVEQQWFEDEPPVLMALEHAASEHH
jgi:hypothetical protein